MTHLKDLNPKVITELTNREFTCRLVTDDQEDIVKALECIYSHYKYDYLHQALYDVDYFKEILQGGRYVAAVAENLDGQVMGFGALQDTGRTRLVCHAGDAESCVPKAALQARLHSHRNVLPRRRPGVAGRLR